MTLAVAVLAVLLAAVAGYAWQLRARTALLERRIARSSQELERLEHAFLRFAPHEVVERIIADGEAADAEIKEITILFADLKGFTPIAETLEPGQLIVLLNGYFERMGQAIGSNRGHLAKLIGDGVLALFGALEPNPWQTNDAVHAALAMQRSLREYNEEIRSRGLPPLEAGIGIHRGSVVAGVLGTSAFKEYGVLGRAVNLASRVEALTRVHDADILVTEAARAHCDQRFRLRPLPAAEVKGIPEAVVTWAVEGFEEAS